MKNHSITGALSLSRRHITLSKVWMARARSIAEELEKAECQPGAEQSVTGRRRRLALEQERAKREAGRNRSLAVREFKHVRRISSGKDRSRPQRRLYRCLLKEIFRECLLAAGIISSP